MLEYLYLQNIGPSPEMEMHLAPRLNLITGDNGLGKGFLLEVGADTQMAAHHPDGTLALARAIVSRSARPAIVRTPLGDVGDRS